MIFPGERRSDMKAGVILLNLFCTDVVKSGLYEGKQVWIEKLGYLSERLVDLKMGALARQIRSVAGELGKSELDWIDLMLHYLGIWHLYGTGLKKILDQEELSESDALWPIWAGWNVPKEQLDSLPAIRDEWIMMGSVRERMEQLSVIRSWFWGVKTRRWAQHLEYLPPFQQTAYDWKPGKSYLLVVSFYPGHNNLRVLIRERQQESFASWPGIGENLPNTKEHLSLMLAQSPFIQHWPVCLQGVYLVKEQNSIKLKEKGGQYILLDSATTLKPEWLLLSQNRHLDIFGEWTSSGLQILSIGYGTEFYF